jgi:hypothetical protein
VSPIAAASKRKRFPFALGALLLLAAAIISAAVALARSSRGTVQAFETPRDIARLKLQGIFFSGSMGYAIVNNEVLQAGDTCGNVRIKEIRPDAVLIQDRGIEYTLKTGN